MLASIKPSQRPRAAIYARFSTDLQNPRSAEDQVRVCREHADREGWDVCEVYSDLAISGTNNNRPGLLAMLGAVDRREVDIVVAEALDRVARDQADTATIFQRLSFAECQLVTVSEGRISELHVGLLGTMNALFVKELGKKIRRGAIGSVNRGRVPGGICYGYEAVPIVHPDGTIEKGHRRIVDGEAAIIRRIFDEFLAGDSPKAIAHRLNREGIPSPRGSEWRATAITGSRGRGNGILHNAIYDGRIVYNRVRMVKDPSTRKRISRVNDAAELVEMAAPDLRIVAADTFRRVQEHAERNAGVSFTAQRRPKHVLSGLVRCGECGGAYTVISKDRWGCIRHRDAGTCSNPRRISTDRLEARVFSGLKNKLLAPDVVSQVVKRYHEARAAKEAQQKDGLHAAEAQVAKLEGEIGRLIDALASGDLPPEHIAPAIAERKERLAIARAQLAEHQALPAIVLHPQIVEAYRRRIDMLGVALGQGERAKRVGAIIRELIEQVNITDDTAADDRAQVEVIGRLAAVLAMAKGESAPARPRRTVSMVAEEGLEPPTRGL